MTAIASSAMYRSNRWEMSVVLTVIGFKSCSGTFPTYCESPHTLSVCHEIWMNTYCCRHVSCLSTVHCEPRNCNLPCSGCSPLPPIILWLGPEQPVTHSQVGWWQLSKTSFVKPSRSTIMRINVLQNECEVNFSVTFVVGGGPGNCTVGLFSNFPTCLTWYLKMIDNTPTLLDNLSVRLEYSLRRTCSFREGQTPFCTPVLRPIGKAPDTTETKYWNPNDAVGVFDGCQCHDPSYLRFLLLGIVPASDQLKVPESSFWEQCPFHVNTKKPMVELICERNKYSGPQQQLSAVILHVYKRRTVTNALRKNSPPTEPNNKQK